MKLFFMLGGLLMVFFFLLRDITSHVWRLDSKFRAEGVTLMKHLVDILKSQSDHPRNCRFVLSCTVAGLFPVPVWSGVCLAAAGQFASTHYSGCQHHTVGRGRMSQSGAPGFNSSDVWNLSLQNK